MASSYSWNKAKENEEEGLSEDFRHPERVAAPYCFPMEGLRLHRDDTRKLLIDLCQSKHPLIQLYIPHTDGEEEARDVKIKQLKNDTLNLVDLSPDNEAISFMRTYSCVRFKFKHRNETYIFETRVKGLVEKEERVLLGDMPETIYRERRKYQRYQLWPNHEAYLEGMQVHDISWSGLGVQSDTSLLSGETLKNVILTLPPIYSTHAETHLYSGAQIIIPSIEVRYRITKEICCYYGMYFDKEWDLEQAQKLGDFLLELRKKIFC